GREAVGRRLPEFIEHLSRERGADRLVLTTGLKNVDAQWFYRAVGLEDHALARRKSLGNGRASKSREIRTPRRAVLWRRHEPMGTKSFLLSSDEGGWHLEGQVVGMLDHKPAHVRYRIACDPAWHTLAAEISLDRVVAQRELHVTVRDGVSWWLEGEVGAGLRACS